MRRVRIERAAKDELRAALAWYEEQEPGLAAKLHAEVRSGMAKLRTIPDGSTPVPGIDPELQLRRIFIDRFPYTIVFMVEDDVVNVIAFAHMSRRPDYWVSRVPQQ